MTTKALPEDTRVEFENHIIWLMDCLKTFKPEKAVRKRIAGAYLAQSGRSFDIGLYQFLLGNFTKAKSYFEQCTPNVRRALSESQSESEQTCFQYALLHEAFLVADTSQTEESVAIVSRLTPGYEDFFGPPEFYIALASLWVENYKQFDKVLPGLEKRCRQKSYRYVVNTSITEAMLALQCKDKRAFISALSALLDGHMHSVRYSRYALGHYDYLCQPALFLCILGLKFGIDAKPHLENTVQNIKARTFSPADRPELPSTYRFKLTVDFVPDFFLEPWREYFAGDNGG